ncbi:MAG: hypothetical protein KGI30_08590 [Planctomycetota bacterium]|nr:hypothetical protein [Planctomycetota bacterium]
MKQPNIKNFINTTPNFKPSVEIFLTKFSEIKRLLSFPFLRFLVFACTIALVVWGIEKVWQSLTDLNIFKVSPATFSFHTPLWVTDRFSDDIKHVATLNEQYGMYENNLAQKIADAYGNVVLIKKVDSIKRTFPNKLNIKLVLRKPAAIVKSGNNTYLVDDECVLLPKEYYTLTHVEYESPYIKSSRLAKLPLYGSNWNDKGVKAGVELLKFLRENNIHALFKILAVDVSNVCKRRSTGKSDIVLWTENNTQIWWGCSSLCKEPSELSDKEKLQNLLSIAKAEGTNLKQMEYVDVRWKKPLGKRWAKANDIVEER